MIEFVTRFQLHELIADLTAKLLGTHSNDGETALSLGRVPSLDVRVDPCKPPFLACFAVAQ